MEYVTSRLQNRASPEDSSLCDSPAPCVWSLRTNYSVLPEMPLLVPPSNDRGFLPCAVGPSAQLPPSAPAAHGLFGLPCLSPIGTTTSNLYAPASRCCACKYLGGLNASDRPGPSSNASSPSAQCVVVPAEYAPQGSCERSTDSWPTGAPSTHLAAPPDGVPFQPP